MPACCTSSETSSWREKLLVRQAIGDTSHCHSHCSACAARGDSPCPRMAHCAGYDEDNGRLVVFGGRTAEKRRLNDVYILDVGSWVWSKMAAEGAVPKPREEAAACFWAGHMLVFGEWSTWGGCAHWRQALVNIKTRFQ
jgi:hypothetical protein